jgi:hypothetical protein
MLTLSLLLNGTERRCFIVFRSAKVERNGFLEAIFAALEIEAPIRQHGGGVKATISSGSPNAAQQIARDCRQMHQFGADADHPAQSVAAVTYGWSLADRSIHGSSAADHSVRTATAKTADCRQSRPARDPWRRPHATIGGPGSQL